MGRHWLRQLRAWAFGDRVRASPREGRLLRIPVGGCVRVAGTVAQVVSREPIDSGEGTGGSGEPGVTYTCRGVAGDLRLAATLVPSGAVRVWLLGPAPPRPLREDEVEVFG